jgi:hypothetical protein
MRNFSMILVLALFCLSCSNNSSEINANKQINTDTVQNKNVNVAVNTEKSVEKTEKGHEHIAPHGGTLIVFGEEFAHLELVLDSETGKITAYVLDGEAEKSVQIAQTEIEISVEKTNKFLVKLEAVENTLTGEKKGATSEFNGESEKLKGLKDFDAEIVKILVKGKEFKNVHFNFPKGNEDKHHKH